MKVVANVDRSERIFANPAAATARTSVIPSRAPLAFHQKLPGYAPSRLVEAPTIAAQLGLERLWVKDESSRFGLPAFKILGASWAIYRAASQRLGEQTGVPLGGWNSLEDLATALAPLRPMTLACATDGNHGRAVARMARLLGFDSRIFVPIDMSVARKQAIESEGAEVVEIDGSYDDAISISAGEASDRCLVISDTSWPGYESVPAAVESHYRRPGVKPRPFILGVEPTRAACAMASIEAGEIVELPPPHDSIMAGLNCGIVSPLAWPVVSGGIDVFIAIEDERTREAMRALAGEGIVAGECGAAGLAGIMTWASRFGGVLKGRRALVISTEGATDLAAYNQIVG